MSSAEHLLAALRADAAPDDWFTRLQGVDYDDLFVTALALGLAPLLHHRLESWGRTLPDPKAQAKLAFARRAEESRHAALRVQLGEVLARLPSPPIVLKGAYLAEKVYPAPGLRPMNDIDLLFRPADLPAAAEALRALGYESKEKSADLGPGITKHLSTFKRPVETPHPAKTTHWAEMTHRAETTHRVVSTPNPYVSGVGERMIEPHGSLEESWFGLKCDLTPGMWERSVEIEIAGQRARALSPEDNLLHLCVHLTFHLIMGSPSFVQLADLSVFLSRVEVHWPDFLSRAESLRAAGYCYAALRLAQRTLAVSLPPDILPALAAASAPNVHAAAETLSLSDVLRRTQRPPLRTLPQRIKRGFEDRLETARWAHSFDEWRRIWGTLFDFTRTDTWQIVKSQIPNPEPQDPNPKAQIPSSKSRKKT